MKKGKTVASEADRALFIAAAEAVAAAIREGHPPPGVRVRNDAVGAIRRAAAAAGIAVNTMRYRYRRAVELGLDGPVREAASERREEVSDGAPDNPADRVTQAQREQALRDEVARLKADLTAALREGNEQDAILALVGRMAKHDPAPPAWLTEPGTSRRQSPVTPEVPVVMWSDWHFGEKVRPDDVNGANAYDTDIARRRIDRLLASTCDICHNHGPGNYPGIVIPLMGDFISGGLHPELLRTDEEGRIPSALSVIDILCGALTRMADEFGRVFCPAVPGNHGRNTMRPEYKGYVHTNFDWLIYQLVARWFEARGDDRVKFLIPMSGDALFRVFSTRFLATHGDMLGVRGGDGIIGALGPITRGEIKMRGQSQSLGRSYDYLLIGHWHQMFWGPRVIVANALKGFDEYAGKALRAVPSTPSQPLFFVHPRRGITSRWEITLEDVQQGEVTEWVSVAA